jgi:hypothetical protein
MELQEFQDKAYAFLAECFGKDILENKLERNYRFFEEAAELVQAAGMTKDDCYKLVDYVYGRPVGEVPQELGGVMITLFGLACAQGFSMAWVAETEIKSCYDRIDHIRSKWVNKKIKSDDPLPGKPD